MVPCSAPSSAELYIGLMAEPVSLPRPVKPTGHPPSPRSVKAYCEYMLGLSEAAAMLTYWPYAARLCTTVASGHPPGPVRS